MGSTSSKHNAVESSSSFSSSSSSSVVRRTRSRGSRVFQSSCLGLASGSHDDDNGQVSDCQRKGNNINDQSLGQVKSESDQVRDECFSEVKAEQSDEITFISSSSELDEWDQSNLSDAACKAGSSPSARSSVPSSRFISRFSFFPSNASFRLNRTASLGSSRAFAVSSTSFTVSNLEDEVVQTGSSSSLVKRNDYSRARYFLPACLNNQSSSPQYGGLASGNLEPNPTVSGMSDDLRDDQVTSVPNGPIHIDDPRVQLGVNLHSPRNQIDLESIEMRSIDRRINAREPAEGNVHFSRTLSVGRLRDRVLRRSLTPDPTFPSLQQERELVVPPQHEGVHDLGGQTEPLPSNDNALISTTSSINNSSASLSGSQDHEVLASRSRETRYHDLLEHRSNFLERRRRIRSQVRALQRLGSRFENLSGHERSCIISGQHRTGHCTCRVNNRNAGSTDDGGARASISRIVMLAEALFEVLDEIHQQSVVLSSRPSVSSIGSVPAPTEVVDALPVKVFSKSHKHFVEETSQCYICLVEYEEGDSVRILPCHHEFHGTCVDKWLKEVHRVCPLCRRDICRTDSAPSDN